MYSSDRDNSDDVASGLPDERNQAIDLQLEATIIYLVDEMAYSLDEVLEALRRLRIRLRRKNETISAGKDNE